MPFERNYIQVESKEKIFQQNCGIEAMLMIRSHYLKQYELNIYSFIY